MQKTTESRGRLFLVESCLLLLVMASSGQELLFGFHREKSACSGLTCTLDGGRGCTGHELLVTVVCTAAGVTSVTARVASSVVALRQQIFASYKSNQASLVSTCWSVRL